MFYISRNAVAAQNEFIKNIMLRAVYFSLCIHICCCIEVIVLLLSLEFHVACASCVRLVDITCVLMLSSWQHRHAMETWLAITFILLTSVISEYPVFECTTSSCRLSLCV